MSFDRTDLYTYQEGWNNNLDPNYPPTDTQIGTVRKFIYEKTVILDNFCFDNISQEGIYEIFRQSFNKKSISDQIISKAYSNSDIEIHLFYNAKIDHKIHVYNLTRPNKDKMFKNNDLNNSYCKGKYCINLRNKKIGIIDGCYLGNDRITPRFKVAIIGGRLSDWYVDSCILINSDIPDKILYEYITSKSKFFK